jgi:ComF family protein
MKQNFLVTLKNLALDLLFPIECLGCGRCDAFLCDVCQAKLIRPETQKCPICKHISARGATCLDCSGKTPLDGVFAACTYRSPLTRTGIHALKYRFIPACAAPLAEVLIAELRNAELPLPQLITPVPLHTRRLRWRGFNQSELIARYLANHLTPGLTIPLDTTSLRRIRFTPPQASVTSRTERLENLKDAFAWRSLATDLTGKTVWLIDDVATTNATLEACARTLKQAGAHTVIGIVLAR